MSWRVGSKVPLNVYDGERPVCQCHTAEDAVRIVAAMNGEGELERLRSALVTIKERQSALPNCDEWERYLLRQCITEAIRALEPTK